MYYKLIKLIIDTLSLIKVILIVIINYYNILDFIINNLYIVFSLKFSFLSNYFFSIKYYLFIIFYFQIDKLTKYQNNRIKVYIYIIINFE